MTALILVWGLFFPGFSESGVRDASASEALAETINAYRVEMGLPEIKVSRWLNEVAELHVRDLEENSPDRGRCNMHSWSKSRRWSSCCYRMEDPDEACMTSKPREITGWRYEGKAYEIAAWSSAEMAPEYALQLWKESPGHHDVIVNRGSWSAATWRSMGAAMSEHYAVVWFGEQ